MHCITSYETLVQKIPEIEALLGYTFINRNHLIGAFIHSSFLNENKQMRLKHNERLEFLGDSVLNLLVSEYLYSTLSDTSEGELSSFRSSIVSAFPCIEFATKLGIQKFILVGKGEMLNTLQGKTSIIADLFEAVLGAIYLDGGLVAVKETFFRHFLQDIQKKIEKPLVNFKASLQEALQKTKNQVPLYKVLDESGPDHNKAFTIGVFVGETLIGKGSGSSKKEAEQKAAFEALNFLQKGKGA
jgi:ribonuclease III